MYAQSYEERCHSLEVTVAELQQQLDKFSVLLHHIAVPGSGGSRKLSITDNDVIAVYEAHNMRMRQEGAIMALEALPCEFFAHGCNNEVERKRAEGYRDFPVSAWCSRCRALAALKEGK